MLWKGFQRPKRLEYAPESLTPTYGKFYAQPFERGFGTTIGNAMRRALLSSIEGAAITAVHIEGVLHEFSSIPGVVEDVTDIILNLKQIPLKLHSEGPETVAVEIEGPAEAKSGDVQAGEAVEILNPDVRIATLNEEGKLRMEMRVRLGRGYVGADANYDDDLPVGFIPIDSVHSPVTKVNFHVEDARLGQTTDYEKLTLEVWTNGTVKPQDAVREAATILRDHLAILVGFEDRMLDEEAPAPQELPELAKVLSRSVDELELSVRARNCLEASGIKTIGDLVQKDESEMLKTKNFGRKSLQEIKDILTAMNLGLGMDVSKLTQKISEGS